MMNDKFLSAATIGFFDGVHCGHQYLIDEVKRLAQARGLKSMVITFDQHPRQVLQADYVPQLLTTTQDKVQLLQGLGVIMSRCCTSRPRWRPSQHSSLCSRC